MLRISVLVAVLSTFLSGCGRGQAAKRESHVASALLAQFESVIYEEPSLLARSGAYRGLSEGEANTLRFPFVYLRGALESIGSSTYADLLGNSEGALVGAKDFRPPVGLGAVRSQRCYVVILKPRSAFDFRKYFHKGAVASAAGMPVWNWTAKLNEFGENDPKPSSLYAAQVGQSYALVSNDLSELQLLAANLRSPSDELQVPEGVRNWSSLSRHDVWGYRRYAHASVTDRMAAGMADIGPGAEALAFFLDLHRKAIAVRLYLNPPTDERTVAMINSQATLPPLHPTGSGVWETDILLSGNEQALERTFIVIGLFGFAVYV
jgi:hypothetical protein